MKWIDRPQSYKDRIYARHRERYSLDPLYRDRIKKNHRNYYASLSDEKKQVRKDKATRDRRIKRYEVKELLGGKCSRCGNSDLRILQPHTLTIKGKHKYPIWHWGWKKIRELICEYELLCANCHIIKHYEDNDNTWPNVDQKK